MFIECDIVSDVSFYKMWSPKDIYLERVSKADFHSISERDSDIDLHIIYQSGTEMGNRGDTIRVVALWFWFGGSAPPRYRENFFQNEFGLNSNIALIFFNFGLFCCKNRLKTRLHNSKTIRNITKYILFQNSVFYVYNIISFIFFRRPSGRQFQIFCLLDMCTIDTNQIHVSITLICRRTTLKTLQSNSNKTRENFYSTKQNILNLLLL